jgi:hypothetical protein
MRADYLAPTVANKHHHNNKRVPATFWEGMPWTSCWSKILKLMPIWRVIR